MISGLATGKMSFLNEAVYPALIQLTAAFLLGGVPCLFYALRGNPWKKERPKKNRGEPGVYAEDKDHRAIPFGGSISYDDYSRIYDIVMARGIPIISGKAKLIIAALICLLFATLFTTLDPNKALAFGVALSAFVVLIILLVISKAKKPTEKQYDKEIERNFFSQRGEISPQNLGLSHRTNTLHIPWDRFDGYVESKNAIALVSGRSFWAFGRSMFKSRTDWEQCVGVIKSTQKRLEMNR